MLNLEMELIAVLLLTAVVGLLMGRFLCKSGENEEKEQKKKVIHAFKTSENELAISREKVKDQSLQMSELEDTIARREQKISNLETKLSSSDKQRTTLLEELKILEKYKPRFEALSNEFKIQTTLVEKIKSEKIANQEEIDEFKILTTRLKSTITDLKKKQEELEKYGDTLQNKIKTNHDNYKREEEENNKKHIVALQAKDKEYNKLEKKYKEIIQKKDDEYEQLKRDNQKAYNELLQKKDNEYEQLKRNNQKAYNDLIQTKDEAYEALELNKSKAYQKMLETKNEAYQELRDELESIENEYEEFKINYNLDNDRLETLEKENKEIYNTLDTIAHERDDLLARLRAISSVVGAVGVDNGSESRQLLLEN